jgi:hypothetical protein
LSPRHCNGDGIVSIDELISGVGAGQVDSVQLIKAVGNALNGFVAV